LDYCHCKEEVSKQIGSIILIAKIGLMLLWRKKLQVVWFDSYDWSCKIKGKIWVYLLYIEGNNMKRWTLKKSSKDLDIKFYCKKRWTNTWQNKTKTIVKKQ